MNQPTGASHKHCSDLTQIYIFIFICGPSGLNLLAEIKENGKLRINDSIINSCEKRFPGQNHYSDCNGKVSKFPLFHSAELVFSQSIQVNEDVY